nr:immunoglobulin light chain junction region [Macaca mulatta]
DYYCQSFDTSSVLF